MKACAVWAAAPNDDNGSLTMLELNPEIVCFLIVKAHEFHAKEGVVIPEEPYSPADDWGLQVLADHQDDATYAEMKATIEDLEPDQQVQLVALMWVGRGDFAIEEWDAALARRRETKTRARPTTS